MSLILVLLSFWDTHLVFQILRVKFDHRLQPLSFACIKTISWDFCFKEPFSILLRWNISLEFQGHFGFPFCFVLFFGREEKVYFLHVILLPPSSMFFLHTIIIQNTKMLFGCTSPLVTANNLVSSIHVCVGLTLALNIGVNCPIGLQCIYLVSRHRVFCRDPH